MKIIYDDQGRLSEVIFAENDDQAKFWDAFNKANEEITNRCKILQEENTKAIQLITKSYLGVTN